MQVAPKKYVVDLLLVNSELSSFFEESIEEAARIDAAYEYLWRSLYDLIKSGGKRLRPYMTLLSYHAFGGNDDLKIAPIAAAQELLHFSLLIHDDIIDRDDTRYGTLNISGQFKKHYSRYLKDQVDTDHFAQSAALLAGDLMLSGAHSLISKSDLDLKEKSVAQQLLSRGIFEVAGGELLDTEASFKPYKSGDALKIARYKTASYSFTTPLLTGASVAGADKSKLDSLKRFAEFLGIAFQLTDDLLGVFGDSALTGKSTDSDITEGKHTFMIEKAKNQLSGQQLDQFESTFGKHNASKKEIDSFKELLVRTGARAAVEHEIAKYAEEAKVELAKLELTAEHSTEFYNLIERATRRVA